MGTGPDPTTCIATLDPGQATATDNCGIRDVKGARSDGLALNAPYPVGVTTITWTATDTAGNVTTCTQTVTVTDSTAPGVAITTLRAGTTVGDLTRDPVPFPSGTMAVDVEIAAFDGCGIRAVELTVTRQGQPMVSMPMVQVQGGVFRATITEPGGGPLPDGLLLMAVTAVSNSAQTTIQNIRVEIVAPPTVTVNCLSTVQEGIEAMLVGTATPTPGHNITSIRWTQTAGPAVVICDANQLTARVVPLNISGLTPATQALRFRLQATDEIGNTSTAECTVTEQNRIIVEDLSNGNRLTVNLATNEYVFLVRLLTLEFRGTATVTTSGNQVRITGMGSTPAQNSLSATVDLTTGIGSATLTSGSQRFTVFDDNVENNVSPCR
jgi:hypothetical protein